jgi:hypothetical protein
MRISVYIHCYVANRWEVILQELISAVIHSGLYEAATQVVVCLQGQFLHNKLAAIKCHFNKIEYRYMGNENKYEWNTLQHLWQDRDQYDAVLYLHTKGSSYPESNHNETMSREKWLKYMLYWNVAKWQEMINAIREGANTCGALFMAIRNGFWCGNFWWASSEWINQLTEPNQYLVATKEQNRRVFDAHFMNKQPREHIRGNRWGCEMWVTDSTEKKIYCIDSSDPQTWAM